jgi:hypothetical protein
MSSIVIGLIGGAIAGALIMYMPDIIAFIKERLAK